MPEDPAVVVEDPALESDPQEDPPLGPAGEKALAAMKEQLKAAKAEAKAGKEAQQRLADLEASSLSEQEKAVKTAREEASTETASKYRTRIVTSEIKAAAGGRLADPADAVRLLDLTVFQLDDNDELDPVQVNEALENLLKAKPYLAAQTPPRISGDLGQGNRTEDKKTIADQIAEATAAGDHRTAMALKAQQLTQLPPKQ